MKNLLSTLSIFILLILGSGADLSAQIVSHCPSRPSHCASRPSCARPGYTWIAGHWKWDAYYRDYVWVNAYWVETRPNCDWVNGFWERCGNGHRWVVGYWAAHSCNSYCNNNGCRHSYRGQGNGPRGYGYTVHHNGHGHHNNHGYRSSHSGGHGHHHSNAGYGNSGRGDRGGSYNNGNSGRGRSTNVSNNGSGYNTHQTRGGGTTTGTRGRSTSGGSSLSIKR